MSSVPSGPPAATLPPPDPREAALSREVLELLEGEHLLRTPVDDTVSREAFKTYLDRLDGGKMFLLKGDRDALAKYADKIDDELHSGALELAHEGSKAFVGRVAVVEKMVAGLLDKPFDFSNEEFVEIDPEKVALATALVESRVLRSAP